MDPHRLQQQITFILEIDKLKSVLRQTYITIDERHENSAEHSWHLATMALILIDHADEKIDLCHVLRLLLVHDIIEIDAGDTYCYDELETKDQSAREHQAAERIFSLLPEDQANTMCDLWLEFESRNTPEAKFAVALDCLMPLLHNLHTEGKSWQEHNITMDQVITRNRAISDGSAQLWQFAQSIIKQAVTTGYLTAPDGSVSEDMK
ncbi:MAG: HD domain-containing protein [Anaerolineales bacterium]|nr:HD domain-containing protein [Anaerolineales bacterium]